MAGSVNKVIIRSARCRSRAQVHPFRSAVCTVSGLPSERYKDRNEQMKERDRVAQRGGSKGKTAENYVAKVGEGHGHPCHRALQTRSWDGKDGRKNYRTEIVAEEVTIIATAPRPEQQGGDEQLARGRSSAAWGSGLRQQRLSQGYEPAPMTSAAKRIRSRSSDATRLSNPIWRRGKLPRSLLRFDPRSPARLP